MIAQINFIVNRPCQLPAPILAANHKIVATRILIVHLWEHSWHGRFTMQFMNHNPGGI